MTTLEKICAAIRADDALTEEQKDALCELMSAAFEKVVDNRDPIE